MMNVPMGSRNVMVAGLALTVAGLIAWLSSSMITPAHKGSVEITQLSSRPDSDANGHVRKAEVFITQVSR